MLIDTLEIEDGTTVEADICIVGSGAAGLSMADALRGSGLEVVGLEAAASTTMRRRAVSASSGWALR